MNRRPLARFIRARQEVWKRLERIGVAPRWRGAADTVAVLDPKVLGGIDAARDDALAAVARYFRDTAASRYPRTHLAHRDPRLLPDAGAVVADAERVLRGDWDVLGRRVHVATDTLDWRAHPLSGVATPALHFSRVPSDASSLGGDVKFLWEINRHAELVRLAQAYWLTRREIFADSAVRLLDSWLDQNPPATGINWISCVDVAFRTIAWCWLWQLTSDSRAWTDERVGRLVWGVAHAARFIARYDSVHHSPNTHLTGEALGLVNIATVFPELRGAERWRRLGIDILAEEAGRQFLSDGMHYERCTGYHRYNLEFYCHALAIARSSGDAWAERLVPPLSRGLEASVHLQRPDGTWPVLGDEDGGSCVRLGTHDVTDQSDLLATVARLVGRRDLLADMSAATSSLGWWTLPDDTWRVSATSSSTTPWKASRALDAAGYFVARDRWSDDAWYALVDAGPHGGDLTGHAHADLGHVEIAHGRQWITVDPGCAIYNSDPERRTWYRSQLAHACLVLDATQLATPDVRPFRWASVAPTPNVDVSDHGTYWVCRLRYEYPTPRGLVAHERQVVLVRGCGVIVCDLLSGTNVHDVDVRWPLAVPRTQVTRCSESSVSLGDCLISWFGLKPQSTTFAVEPTRRSPKFGEEVDASALVLSQRAASMPCALLTAFTRNGEPAPRASVQGDAVDVTIPIAPQAGAGTVHVALRRNQPPRVERAG